jgi:hypothetical protein
VRVLGRFGFKESKLQTIQFEPESEVAQIEMSCFESCPLASICIPRSVRQIGDCCFSSCTDLETVTFEPGSQVIHIGNASFCSCPVKIVAPPPSIEVIGKSFFDRCTNLQTLAFDSQAKLKEIDGFNSCQMLEKIEVPASVEVVTGFNGLVPDHTPCGIKAITFAKDSHAK